MGSMRRYRRSPAHPRSPADPWALQEQVAGVVLVAIGAANVGAHGARIAVTGLVHAAVQVGAAIGGRGDEAGAQRVAGEIGASQAGRRGVAFHNVGDGAVGQPLVPDLAGFG